MSIASTDLVAFASANMPTANTGTNGGAIDTKHRVDFTQLAANDTVEVISTSASDTQNCTIVGRNAAGSIVTQTAALTGTTAKAFSTLGTIERILSASLASDAVGTITVRRTTGPTTIRTIPVGERGFMALFQQLASDPSVTTNYYAKIFLKNTHGSLALLGATVKQSADPDARITHLLATAVDDTNTATDRTTAPATSATQDPDTFDDTDKSVPGTDLAAGSAIGVWLRLQLPGGDAAHRTTYTIQLAGSST